MFSFQCRSLISHTSSQLTFFEYKMTRAQAIIRADAQFACFGPPIFRVRYLTDRQTDRQDDRQKDRKKDRQTETRKHKHKHRQTDRQKIEYSSLFHATRRLPRQSDNACRQ